MKKDLLIHTGKTAAKLVAGCIMLLACTQVPAQTKRSKGPLELADQYYAAGEYYTAAHLYGQFLHPSKKQLAPTGFPLNSRKGTGSSASNVSRTAVLFRQAESYRKANYWQEAAEAYKKCSESDENAYADAMYWYAVCKRHLGQYDTAAETLKQYTGRKTVQNKFEEEAQNELQTLGYIQQQMHRADSILYKVEKLSATGSGEKGLFAPARIGNGQFLVSSTESDSATIAGKNPYHSRLFYATISNGSLQEMTPLSIPAAEDGSNQGAGTVSIDGKHLYFTQWKKENGKTVSAIYYSAMKPGGWSTPVLLSSVNADGYNAKQPFCSADGKYLYFSSDRPGGAGQFDIWYAPLNGDGTTGKPVNAGTAINTEGDEQSPFYHTSSETLVFSSNGKQGMGGYDLFAAKGREADWKIAENLGHPVNSSRDDIYFFAPEQTKLLSQAIFSSDRGTGCCLETYMVSKTPKKETLTGTIYDYADKKPIPGATVTMQDESGKTWTTATDPDGKYVFDLADTSRRLTLSVSKDTYKDTATFVSVDKIDESNLLVDVLTNTELYIDKKPEPPKLVIKAENVITVFFDFDRSVLKAAGIEKLDSLYNVLQEFPNAIIQVSGYTDGLGSEEYNKKLSDKRAKACVDYLVSKGIDQARISFASFGACCPVEMEIINGRDNSDGRSRNRRALINVQKD